MKKEAEVDFFLELVSIKEKWKEKEWNNEEVKKSNTIITSNGRESTQIFIRRLDSRRRKENSRRKQLVYCIKEYYLCWIEQIKQRDGRCTRYLS